MQDRITSIVVAISLAILVWLFARSRHLESLNQDAPQGSRQSQEHQSESSSFEVDAQVHFLCPADFPYEPRFGVEQGLEKVKVRLAGPAHVAPPAVTAYIDLTRKPYNKGVHEGTVHLEMPVGFRLDEGEAPVKQFELLAK